MPCIGSFCPVLRPGLGAVGTQAWTNPALPYRIFKRLAAGDGATQALAAVMASEVDAALRQVGVVDGAGRVAGFTGGSVEPAFGQRSGDGTRRPVGLRMSIALLSRSAELLARRSTEALRGWLARPLEDRSRSVNPSRLSRR